MEGAHHAKSRGAVRGVKRDFALGWIEKNDPGAVERKTRVGNKVRIIDPDWPGGEGAFDMLGEIVATPKWGAIKIRKRAKSGAIKFRKRIIKNDGEYCQVNIYYPLDLDTHWFHFSQFEALETGPA